MRVQCYSEHGVQCMLKPSPRGVVNYVSAAIGLSITADSGVDRPMQLSISTGDPNSNVNPRSPVLSDSRQCINRRHVRWFVCRERERAIC